MKPWTVATYNVNSIRSRLHIIQPWLAENRPDVFCMQETKVGDDKFPVGAFAELGYTVTFRGFKQYNGVATASLQAPGKVLIGLDDGGPADEDRLVTTVFPEGVVVNAYVPQGRDPESEYFRYKLAWYGRFKAFLARHFSPAEPLLWCGDLNVAREPIDVHDPKRLLGHVDFHPEVWAAFDDVCAWGLTDVFRKHHPGEAAFTFYDYRVPGAMERGLGWRIDHILATPSLAERSTSCTIDLAPRRADKPSDHTVLTATFRRE